MVRVFDQPGRSPVFARNGAAATSHPLATQTALSVLREGGNAVDAAIAASATLCVVEPHMTGIGGDCFVIVCEPDGSIHGLNGSGRSAKRAKPEWFAANGIGEIGAESVHSVTVPGAVRAWTTLHGRFGAMDFARLFGDAVRYANEGYVVAPRVARDWAALSDRIHRNEGAMLHLLKQGRVPTVGDVMAAPALAAILKRIAKEGADAFYLGEVAADIVATVAQLGGLLGEADLAACQADWVSPISARFHGMDVHEIPPNGQGITALILMRLLERFGNRGGPGSGARHFAQIEAARLAYGVRDSEIGDPAHMRAASDRILSDEFIDALGAGFDPERRNPSIRLPRLPGSDTVYLSVVDRDLRCVSFINSVYGGFGSGICTKKTGIVLQNRGSGFTLQPGHPNCIGPAKRPLHTIIPAMATRDGRPEICFGVMGGAYQPMGHAHVLSNLLVHGMDPQEAIDDARMFWDDDGVLVAESGISEDVREHLRQRGFAVKDGGPFGGGQMIRIDHKNGVLIAASDPRKDGHAGGY